jgi:hypothetical protein
MLVPSPHHQSAPVRPQLKREALGSNNDMPRTHSKPLQPPTYSQLIDDLTASDAASAIERTIERLRAIGATPPSGSRLHQAKTTIQQKADSPALAKPGSLARRLYAEAHRTAFEFSMIAVAINSQGRLDRRLHQKLQRAYSGSLDPATTAEKSQRARDMQFELYLGAWLAIGGQPVHPSRADLRVSQWFEWRGVAAKRIQIPSQLVRRVKSGADQILQDHATGFVCVSLDNYSLRRNRARITAASGAHFFSKYPYLDAAEKWLVAERPAIHALLAFGSLARWEPKRTPPRLDLSRLTRIMILTKNPSQRERLTDFFAEHQRTFDKFWHR